MDSKLPADHARPSAVDQHEDMRLAQPGGPLDLAQEAFGGGVGGIRALLLSLYGPEGGLRSDPGKVALSDNLPLVVDR